MIISLETENKLFQDLFKPAIIGPFLIFVIAMLPIPLLFVFNHYFSFAENAYIEKINALVAGIWNILLTFVFKIKIKLIFIPCWILFIVIGLLRYFGVIGK